MSQDDRMPPDRRSFSFGLFGLLCAVTTIALLLICIRVAYTRGYSDGEAQSASEAVTPEIYNIGDLAQRLPDLEFADQLWIKIEPTSWARVGGPGTFDFFALNQLLIVQTPKIHEEIRKEFERLRAELPPETPAKGRSPGGGF